MYGAQLDPVNGEDQGSSIRQKKRTPTETEITVDEEIVCIKTSTMYLGL